MTEAEWLACTDPILMLEWLRGKARDQQLRLFACACCRRIWHLITDTRSRMAVQVAEEYAYGRVGEQELRRAGEAAEEAAAAGLWELQWGEETTAAAAATTQNPMTIEAAKVAATEALGAAAEKRLAAEESPIQQSHGEVHDLRFQCQLLRDIFGSPFRSGVDEGQW